MSEGRDVIPQADWERHPWLSRLKCGSDLDGDAAFFVPETEPAVAAMLEGVQLQYSYDGNRWESVEPVNTGSFPSESWARAAWAWYWPFLEHPLLAVHPDYDSTIKWRAVLPRPSEIRSDDA